MTESDEHPAMDVHRQSDQLTLVKVKIKISQRTCLEKHHEAISIIYKKTPAVIMTPVQIGFNGSN